MNANELIQSMKEELKTEINNNELDLEKLDDILYNCVEEIKHIVQTEANEILEKELEVKKNALNVIN